MVKKIIISLVVLLCLSIFVVMILPPNKAQKNKSPFESSTPQVIYNLFGKDLSEAESLEILKNEDIKGVKINLEYENKKLVIKNHELKSLLEEIKTLRSDLIYNFTILEEVNYQEALEEFKKVITEVGLKEEKLILGGVNNNVEAESLKLMPSIHNIGNSVNTYKLVTSTRLRLQVFNRFSFKVLELPYVLKTIPTCKTQFVNQAHQRHMAISFNLINDKDAMYQALKVSADMIVTDEPLTLIEILKAK